MKKNSAGMTLLEMLIGVVISSIVCLGVADLIFFAYSRYNLLLNENNAEQNLLMSAYYLKSFLSQAVNTNCMGSSAAPIAIPAGPFILPTGVGTPPSVAQGVVDCRVGTTVWTSNTFNAIALFNRENGGGGASLVPGLTDSVYQGVGIYFYPPSGGASGALSFSQSNGTTVTTATRTVTFNNIVNIQVVAGSQLSSAINGALESINYDIKVRYFLGLGVQSYAVVPPANIASYVDIDMTVAVGLHDNSLGSNVTGVATSERLNGGLYYFSFQAPLPTIL